MLDLASTIFQATTLNIVQLLWWRAKMAASAAVTTGSVHDYYVARRNIYHAELVRRWLILRLRIAVWRNRMLVTNTDEGLFQYKPEAFEDVRPEIVALLLAGEYVWWHDGSESWRAFEVARTEEGELIWNEEHTQFLVNILIYTLQDGVTTSRVVGTFWRTPANG